MIAFGGGILTTLAVYMVQPVYGVSVLAEKKYWDSGCTAQLDRETYLPLDTCLRTITSDGSTMWSKWALLGTTYYRIDYNNSVCTEWNAETTITKDACKLAGTSADSTLVSHGSVPYYFKLTPAAVDTVFKLTEYTSSTCATPSKDMIVFWSTSTACVTTSSAVDEPRSCKYTCSSSSIKEHVYNSTDCSGSVVEEPVLAGGASCTTASRSGTTYYLKSASGQPCGAATGNTTGTTTGSTTGTAASTGNALVAGALGLSHSWAVPLFGAFLYLLTTQ